MNVQLFERLAALVRAAGSFTQPTLIIAAAGNESRRDESPDFEIAVSPPAVSEGIISVAALGQGSGGFSVAPFSNTGANLSGPGCKYRLAENMAVAFAHSVEPAWPPHMSRASLPSGRRRSKRHVASMPLSGSAGSPVPRPATAYNLTSIRSISGQGSSVLRRISCLTPQVAIQRPILDRFADVLRLRSAPLPARSAIVRETFRMRS